MIPFLDQQPGLNYRIYVVNQTDELPFNRAKLLNVGFVESMVDFNWTCLIFHDIDLLPLNTTNNYTCSDRPLHMSARINIFDYKVPYAGIFGGVSALTPQHFTLVNGFSNLFWGWGGEDDDMWYRIHHHGLHIDRLQDTGFYFMIKHADEKKSAERFSMVNQGKTR